MSILDYLRATRRLRHRPTLDPELKRQGGKLTTRSIFLCAFLLAWAISATHRHAPTSDVIWAWICATGAAALAIASCYLFITGWWRELKRLVDVERAFK